jgi:hypothetical protein
MTLIQRVAICFAAGVVGALAVVLFSHVLFALGIGQKFGVKEPVSLKSPDVYRPLCWGGLWGIPFGLLIDAAWLYLYLFGFLYFLAPVLALFLIFLPISGAGYFGLRNGGPKFMVYLLLISAVRDHHRFGRKGNNRGVAVRNRSAGRRWRFSF